MRKFAILAFAFVLSGVLLAGCRGGNTDMTTIPGDNASNTTQNGSLPGDGGAENRGNNGMHGENSHRRIQPPRGF